jgi:hypothetical protein
VDEFATKVLPVVVRHARSLHNEELEAIALVLAWWAWSHRKQELPPSVWARVGVRHARAGRDLPGIKSKFRDVWDHLEQWQGGSMGQVVDRRPGPAGQAAWKEELAAILAHLSAAQQELAELVQEEGILRTDELARRLGKTPGRISQMRREIKDVSER